MHPRLIALLAAVGLISSIASAGVVPLSRSSLAKIEGQVLNDNLNGSVSFNQFGAFNDGVTKSGGDPEPGTRANADAGQNTIINTTTPGLIHGSGTLSTVAFAALNPNDTSGPAQVLATSQLTVTFQIVDHAEPFHVSGTFQSNDPIGATSHFSLLRTSDPNNPNGTPVFTTDNALGTIIGGGLDFADTQSLPVGSYKLFVDSLSGSSGSGRGDPHSFGQSTGVDFNFTAGQTATAIPLPAALWPGLVAIGGVLGRLTYRRRTS